jgi:hypothetical protein
MADYGTPMGTEPPGQTTRQRPTAKEATPAERKAALASLEARSQGEARRSNSPGRGTSQGDSTASDFANGVKALAPGARKKQLDSQIEKEGG